MLGLADDGEEEEGAGDNGVCGDGGVCAWEVGRCSKLNPGNNLTKQYTLLRRI